MRIPLLALGAVLCTCAQAHVVVDEANIRAHLVNGKTVVRLGLDSQENKPVQALVELQWLGPANEQHASARVRITVVAGKSSVEIPMPLSEKINDPLLERLRYQFDAEDSNLTAFEPVQGIVSLIHIADYAFSLRVITPSLVQPGEGYELRVLTFHPANGRPVSGVSVECDKSKAISNSDGVAILHVTSSTGEPGPSYVVRAHVGDFSRRRDSPEMAVARRQVTIQTDKPIYQPGQTMHMRILALAPSGKAEAGAAHSLKLFNEKEDVEYAGQLKTSRFGIAAADWEIPGNAKPGQYRIQVDGDDEDQGLPATRAVSIRRYELPSFRVAVHLDKTYYLPHQTATLEVRGEYLFGKPVIAGRIRITEGDEGVQVRQGELSPGGMFRMTFDVGEPQFGEMRFIDRHFTAFITDASTNRTEQRKFDLRVSRDPVHIYIAKEENTPSGQRVWITTYSPDGAPARSDVTVFAGGHAAATGRTNRFGIVRLDLPRGNMDFLIRAVTSDGRRVEQQQPSYGTGNGIWLETERTLYKAGEVIRCKVSATQRNATVVVLAWNRRGQVLVSRNVQLSNGQAFIDLPYDPRFGKELGLAAFSGTLDGSASRMVIFPRAEELGLRVVPVQNQYRPGEMARVEFHTSTQAALGIALLDQSVLERASTDAEFGSSRWFDSDTDQHNGVSGITYSDLLHVDPAKIDDDWQRVAEVLVESPLLQESSDQLAGRQQSAYSDVIGRELQPLKQALDDHYVLTLDYPRDENSFYQIADGLSGTMIDPWMTLYFPRFSREGPTDVLRICSAGPDKQTGTSDDFCPLEIERRWFAPFESVMREALVRLQDFPATSDKFFDLLDHEGIRFDRLKDPWRTPLRCNIAYERGRRVLQIKSAGADRQWDTGDDFTVAEFRGSYFSAVAARIETALQAQKKFPQAEGEFQAALAAAGIKLGELHDPWGRGYYVDLHSEESFYDRPQIYTYEEYQGLRSSRTELIPTKRSFLVADIKSVGEDGVANTYDDFVVTSFFRMVENSSSEPQKKTQPSSAQLSLAGTGTVAGRVLDPTGAPIANVRVTLNDAYVIHTNSSGEYIFGGTPGGYFRLKFEAPGFQTGVLDRVPVEPDHVTKADFVLQVGSVSETVEVSARPNTIATSNAESTSVPARGTIATPRVREYFPETLYWNPELVTDEHGRAAVKVKLADSITTWHLVIVASSEDGRITEASTDIRAFQPFQVDLDVPSVLTEGDQIALPVPVRNYLARAQTVKIAAQSEGGLAVEEPLRQSESIAASGSANVLLALRAQAGRQDSHLRVTAIGQTASDAIEKPILIHPDGERIERSVAGIVGNGQVLRVDVPPDTIPGSLNGEVKVYPTLISRLLEAMQALLQRPYGCGEQTISSTYPNLLFLRAMKHSGLQDDKLEARAMRNLKSGYARLLGYQSDQGGFQYWASGEPDAALTAYALNFLIDAKGFMEVDDDRIDLAQKWLKQQPLSENSLHGLTLWALVKSGERDDAGTLRELGELARKAVEYEDPYSLAVFAIAAMDAGRPDLAEPTIRRLSELSRNEEGTAYWVLRSNTPFHGWGRAGQIETTALVLSAFARWQQAGGRGVELIPLIQRGALFLLKNTDADGAWSSSQATVRALLALVETSTVIGHNNPSEVEILLNGASAGRIGLGNSRHPILGPTILDISRLLHPGTNELSIRSDGTEPIQLQFNTAWYEQWARPHTTKEFAMDMELSTTKAAVNEAVTCRVKITRAAFRGYGMMIAKIGLPPGAEVDRGTLAGIVDDPKRSVDSFEVAPDHVTFYIWPQAADSTFQFVFRPRFAMTARMAQSIMYDYYNPDERVALVPQTFSVK